VEKVRSAEHSYPQAWVRVTVTPRSYAECMQLWQPVPDEPERLDWWRPLLAVRRRAEAERVSAPVHTDEFVFRGRVDRGSRPAVWIYEHRHSGREMLADGKGRTYEFVRYRTGCQVGRFNEIGVWCALLRARVAPATGTRPAVRRRHLYLVPPPSNLN
jgi:hypothetical protein